MPGASPRDSEEPVYEGSAGRTRLRAIHVPLPSGFVRTLSVYDVVNVGTHPNLREPALTGALHRGEGGEVLAIPFVFHDPVARKLALVVPEVLRHEELRLRAELLADIARDPEHPVPSYVREASAVIGAGELARYLERPSRAAAIDDVMRREAELAQREAAVVAREGALGPREAAVEKRAGELEAQIAALGQRESRLLGRAEEVTRREDELRSFSEEIEAAQADIGMREQELEARFEMLRQREAELAERAERARPEDALELVDDEVEEMDELEPLATSPGDVLGGEVRPLAEAVHLVEDSPKTIPPSSVTGEAEPRPRLGGLADVQAVEDLADEVEEDVDDELADDLDDEVEELDEVESIGDVTGIHAGLIEEDTDLRRRPRTEPPLPPPTPIAMPASDPPPSVAPPPGFVEGKLLAPMSATLEAGAVRLFARVPDGFGEEPDLLAQLVTVEERPVVVLTLVSGETALRAALDPRAQRDRAILQSLRRRFAARVGLFSEQGRYAKAIEVAAPREVNVARILDRVSRMRAAAAIDVDTAIERALSAPPPVAADDHPFTSDEAPLGTAAEAASALDQLAEWSSHDKLDHALLVLSIPRDRVDGTVRRVLEAAVEHGLALPDGLPDRAISLGVAPDVATLVARMIEAFAWVSAEKGRGGLSAERAADNWERLLKMAADSEVAIDTETHDLAWRVIREVRGGGDGPAIDTAKLPEMGAPELVLLLEHPRHRRDAALELCRRKDAALAETLCKSVRKMPRAEVVRVVPRIVDLGDGAGDAIIDGLGARKTFVRQAFALALGHLKLRRAVVPLVHLLASEESEVWREIARVVGTFGNASLRNVTRLLRDPKGNEERYVWTLAHLANHGCAKQVERLGSEGDPGVATMAREAMTFRERARAIEDQVRGKASLAREDAIASFSRRFYQELEGKAPVDDLADEPG